MNCIASHFIRLRCLPIVLLSAVSACGLSAQTLNLPPRAANAPTGTEFVSLITPLSRADRENTIFAQIAAGNVPNWLRALTLVSTNVVIGGTNHTVSYYVTPDYCAIGSDQDYFLTPMTPLLAQRLANYLNCSLPTRKMVNDIWIKAPCHLAPSPIAPSPEMTTVPVFNQHNTTVRGQRFAVTNTFPLGTLTGGDKKDVIIANKIYTNFANTYITKPVVIYGWHQLNGSPIQPLYNGHEETYADYSHGIRLVQMAITVDGAPNTVTNVLQNAVLHPLLSDEGVIAKPYYTVAQTGPTITTPPWSQTVRPGTNVTFTVAATGTPPLLYQWRGNGVNLTNATNATLTLNNVQPASAGEYQAVVSNSEGSTVSLPAVLRVDAENNPVLFADNFDTNSDTNWNLFWGAANGLADYTADWAFHYGTNTYTFNGATYFIPPAPRSGGTTRGVRFTANNNDTNAFPAGVNIYPKSQTFSGNFALKVEVWLNYPGGTGGSGSSGSTEHALFGLNHLGTRVNWAGTNAPTDGLFFAMAGEGGTSRDYRAYVGNTSGAQSELIGPAASGLAESNNAAGVYPALFPAARFESPGAPGKGWVEAEVQQLNGIVTWKLDGTVVAQRTNTSSFTAGTIMLGFMDTFSSIASPAKDAFVIFDNVRVEDLSHATNQPPAITAPPTDRGCNTGENVNFGVAASGTPPLFYQWYFNGAPITGASTTSLALNNVQTADSGQYRVIVSNEVGTAGATATLTVWDNSARFEAIAKPAGGPAEIAFAGLQGGDYVMEASTNLSDWQPIRVLRLDATPMTFVDPDAPGFFFRFYRGRSAAGWWLTDFESFAPGDSVLFQKPSTSGSTTNFVDLAAVNFAVVTNDFPAGNDSIRVLQVAWSFKTGATNAWLRLTTYMATNLPNPIVGFSQALTFSIYADRDLYVAVGLRETNPTGSYGENGGVTGAIEWIGATASSPPQGKRVAAGQWTTLQFLIPREPTRAFTGNGVLDSTTGKGVLEHLAFVPASGAGAFNVWLDDFQVVDLP